ncbi:hypothetical protein AC578_10442 [Pseudocercospora eumusae]|uniref:Uncharacterized protein n=1 Tax=Pseudocercospora eumusae TaxID=321146 RepID=A0A139H2N7_9PEZI|nr:hypothetical protein AC578_10442 [Pseudocercospora eumusae]
MHAIEDAAVMYGLLGVAHATVAPTGGQDRHAHNAILFKHKPPVQIQQDLRKGGVDPINHSLCLLWIGDK